LNKFFLSDKNKIIVDSSPAFEEFLGLLGKKIRLLDWKKFRGGLDVKSENLPSDSNFNRFLSLAAAPVSDISTIF